MTKEHLMEKQSGPASGFDVEAVRRQFPVLHQQVHGKDLVYLDSAATSQKPLAVIEATREYYEEYNANIHRAVHALGERSTKAYEDAREKVARFINAPDAKGLVFTSGTTGAINLVARSFVRPRLQPGDEVLITHLEHHSNIVPWQLVCEEAGAKVVAAPVTDDGELDMDAFSVLLNEKTKFVSVAHVSNALGTVLPVKRIVALAHEKGIPVMLDGAQAVPHRRVDVQDLDCDFYALSAHKMYGPTGIGALWGRTEHLQAMPPYQGGGEMIRSVSFEGTTYNEIPHKFEAGTPNIVGAVGFGTAVDFLEGLGMQNVEAHEKDLLEYLVDTLEAAEGVKLLGRPKDRSGAVSFTLEGVHPHDVGTLLDRDGVAIRTGHHCAMPLMKRFQVPATVRASIGVYTTKKEIDALAVSLQKVREVFA
jgi:cysteine desulfurase / selenocysteine lyase